MKLRQITIAATLLIVASLAGSSAAARVGGLVKSGTGFFVSHDGAFVTSAHVVAGCANVSVWGPDGSERRSDVIASDPRLDIALLRTGGRRIEQSAVAAGGPPQRGEEVFTLGFGVLASKPLQPVFAEGSLLGESTIGLGNRILLIRARFRAGNSGGALLGSDGSLVGMIIGRDEKHLDLGVALPSEDIEALLAGFGIILPSRRPSRNTRDFLADISALVQCSTPK